MEAKVMLPPKGRSTSFSMLSIVARAIMTALSHSFNVTDVFLVLFFINFLSFPKERAYKKPLLTQRLKKAYNAQCSLRRNYPYQVKGFDRSRLSRFRSTPVLNCVLGLEHPDYITDDFVCQEGRYILMDVNKEINWSLSDR